MRMMVAEVQQMEVTMLRSALLTVLWEHCLSGKLAETLQLFLADPGWNRKDLVEAFGVCFGLAILEDTFSDSPKFQERWLKILLAVFPPGAQQLAPALESLHRATQYMLSNCEDEDEEDPDDDRVNVLIQKVSAVWDLLLGQVEKDSKTDITQGVLDGVLGFLQFPGCPGGILDSIGARANKCPRLNKATTEAWFREQLASGSTAVTRMTHYFGIK